MQKSLHVDIFLSSFQLCCCVFRFIKEGPQFLTHIFYLDYDEWQLVHIWKGLFKRKYSEKNIYKNFLYYTVDNSVICYYREDYNIIFVLGKSERKLDFYLFFNFFFCFFFLLVNRSRTEFYLSVPTWIGDICNYLPEHKSWQIMNFTQ